MGQVTHFCGPGGSFSRERWCERYLLLRPLGVDEAKLDGLDSRLGAVGDAELGDDALEVALDRGEAQVQSLGDLAVCLARGHRSQHVELPWSQGSNLRPVQLPCGGWRLRGLTGFLCKPPDQLHDELLVHG